MILAAVLLVGLALLLGYAGFVTVKVSAERDADGNYLMSAPIALIIVGICVSGAALTLNAAFSL